MEYTHSEHIHLTNRNAFKLGISINLIFIVVEIIFGFLSSSMALISDAGHNFSDVMTLAFSWFAIIISQRKPTPKFTYGFRRSTIMIALFNTLLLLVTVGYIAWETVSRIGKSVPVNSVNMIIIASIGITVNGFTAWLFQRRKSKDINIRSAFVHFLADALVSFGVVIGGILISLTSIYWIDSVVSFIVILVILYSTYHLLVDSISLAIDAVPDNIDIEKVKDYLLSQNEVTNAHDLHIWALSTTETALTVHITTTVPTDTEFISNIQKGLKEKFGIGHATIQIEFGSFQGEQDKVCN